MQYGDWKDWLLCLVLVIGVEARLPSMDKKNPEGHSPRYWRKHPQAKTTAADEAEQNLHNTTHPSAEPPSTKFTTDRLFAVLGILGSFLAYAPFLPLGVNVFVWDGRCASWRLFVMEMGK